jgi:integrase
MNPYHSGKPTISPQTAAAYDSTYRRQWKRFANETGRSDLTPDELVANLIVRRPEYAMSSWRSIKASVLHVLETKFPQCHEAITLLRSQSSAGLAKRSANTSGRKRKEVPLSVWKALSTTLQARAAKGHKHSQGLLDVLRAILLTGMRPNELCYSTISVYASDSERRVLRIRNSKHSNGRGNGAYREMFIDGLDDNELSTLRRALTYCRVKTIAEEKKIQTALKNELDIARDVSVISKKSPGTSVALYSFRHQFLADAKQTFQDPVMVAALAGHASTKTAFEHYGKRRNAKGKVKVLPTPESVEAVQKVTLEIYKEFAAERNRTKPNSPSIS